MFKSHPAKTSVVILGLLCGLMLLSFFVGSLAVSADTPPRPTLTPTPIPWPTPIVTPIDTPQPEETAPTKQSATIILTLSNPVPTYWTSVQWLDEDEEWQDVSGWQSDFNEDGMVAWAVAAKDYGTGPYRWVVYDEAGGTVHATTDLFYLPESKRVLWISGDN